MLTWTFPVDAAGSPEPYVVQSQFCRKITVMPQYQDSGVNWKITGANSGSTAAGKSADQAFVCERHSTESDYRAGDRPFSMEMVSGGSVTWIGIEE